MTETNKRYYWMKFQRDFFKSLRIKKLRRLAGGDTFTIIYLKLQLLSITDGGYLWYKHVLENFAEEMAEEIDEDVENVALTIQYLINSGLMEQQDDEFFLPYAADNIGSETASAQRVRDYRERKKEEKLLQCNTTVTEVQQLCNTEIEIDKEIDIEISSKEDMSKSTRVDYQSIVEKYNSICVSYPKIKTLSDARKKAIKARLNTYTLDDLFKVFEKAQQSDFLKGNNNRNWTATFDWLLKDSNFAKVLDGNYDNKGSSKPKPNNQFNQFENKQDYDFAALDKWGGG